MAVIYDSKDQFLIAKRPSHKMYGDLWEFPGGKVNVGEAPEDALTREIFEELAAKVIITEKLDEYVYDNGEDKIKFIPFICSSVDSIVNPLEHQELLFISANELHNFEFAPPDYAVVDYLNSKSVTKL